MDHDNELFATIDGSREIMKRSARAMMKLSEKWGGLMPLLDALNLGYAKAAVDVCFYALEMKDSQRDALEKKVYDAGLKYLIPILVKYVIALLNGGRLTPEKVAATEQSLEDYRARRAAEAPPNA
jgi:hypothetical protein